MLGLVKQINSILAVILNHLPTVPDPMGGGAEGHVPPTEEAMSALSNTQKTFFSCTAERKGGGAQIEL